MQLMVLLKMLALYIVVLHLGELYERLLKCQILYLFNKSAVILLWPIKECLGYGKHNLISFLTDLINWNANQSAQHQASKPLNAFLCILSSEYKYELHLN